MAGDVNMAAMNNAIASANGNLSVDSVEAVGSSHNTEELSIHVDSVTASPSRKILLEARRKVLLKNKRFEAGRNRITLQQKKQICQYKLDHPKAYAREIYLHFRNKWPRIVAPSTISKILANSDRWMLLPDDMTNQQVRKSRIYHPRHRRLEAALYLWYMNFKDSMNITNNMLRDKSHEIASELNLTCFHCSKKWMHSFKKRHDILKFKCKARPGVKILSIDLDYSYESINSKEVEAIPTEKKVTYYEELTEGTIHVTAPITMNEARDGLMSSMGYLAAHPSIARNYIDLLWEVFQVVTSNPQPPTTEQSYNLQPEPVKQQTNMIQLEDIKNQADEVMDYSDGQENTGDGLVDQTARHSETELSIAELLGATMQNSPKKHQIGNTTNENKPEVDPVDLPQIEGYQLPNTDNTLNLSADSGQIQYAVQSANGDYVLILAESDNQGQDLDLTTILTAAGHTPVDGTRVIQTIDPVTGLRTITMDDKQPSPVPVEKTVIEVVSAANQAPASDGIQDSTVTTATSLPGDHMYITKTDDDEQMDGTQNDIATLSAAPGTSASGKIVAPLKMTVGDQVYDLMPIDSTDDVLLGNDKSSPVMPAVIHVGDNDEGKLDKSSQPTLLSEITNDHIDGEGDNTDNLSSEVGELSLMKEIGFINKEFVSNSPFKSPIADCVVKIKRLPKVLSNSQTKSKTSSTHVCPDCDKVFTSLSSLATHKKSHAKKLPKPIIEEYSENKNGYKCNVCEKIFTRHTSYKSHMQLHTGECHCSACMLEKQSESTGSPYGKSPARSSKASIKSSLVIKGSLIPPTVKEPKDEDAEDVKPHICQVCGRCFNRSCELTCHMKAHEPREDKQNNECSICQESFPRQRELLTHMKTHEQDVEKDLSERECKICGRVFSNKANLRKHMKLHSGMMEYDCTQCDERFLNSEMLKEHRKIHQGKDNDCKLCGKEFVRRRNLNQHMLLHHQIQTTPKSDDKSKDDKLYKCKRCDKSFVLARNLKVHLSVHHRSNAKKGMKSLSSKTQKDLKFHKCNRCEKSFKLARNLDAHKKTKHAIKRSAAKSSAGKASGSKNKTSSKKPFKCNRCTMTFILPHNLREHKIRCHPSSVKGRKAQSKDIKDETEANKCLTCNKTLKNLEAFKVHIKTHLEEQLYKCPACEMLFNNAEDIKQHVLIHTGEKAMQSTASPKLQKESPKSSKTYTCTACGQVFTSMKPMQEHMRTHLNEADGSEEFFGCHVCGKNMSNAQALKKHIQTHNHNRPTTVCPVCQQEFQYPYNMKRHLINAHPDYSV